MAPYQGFSDGRTQTGSQTQTRVETHLSARPQARARLGTNLAELMCGLAIVAILLSLLLPAVLKSLESARRLQCQVNLRNWGQAVNGFVAARDRFPPAATWRVESTGAGANSSPRVPPRHSVFTYLLPYCDEVTLSQHVDLTRDWNDRQNDRWTHQDLAGIFLCPSAPGDRSDKHATDYTTAVRVDPTESTGIGNLIRRQHVRNRSQSTSPHWGAGETAWDGILQLDQVDYQKKIVDRRVVRPGDVVDGTSKTMLFFENAGKPGCYRFRRRADCQITRFRWASSSIWLTVNDYCREQQLVNCHNNSQPYGFHDDGLNAVYADGSVRFIETEVSADIFVAAVTIAALD